MSASDDEDAETPALKFHNVEVRYAGGVIALRDVSLSVRPGAFCAIIGTSGSGKSSLLRAAIGLVTPAAGVVTVNGVTLSKPKLGPVRRRMGMIHQRFNLVGRLTAAQNVMSGAAPNVSLIRCLLQWYPRAVRLKACTLIERMGLEETQLNQRADTLSGGQQQRIGIARALMLDPELILADEPIASLDPRTARDILTLLREAARERGAAVVCSLHQPELAQVFADHLIALKRGRVVYDGPPGELPPEILETIYDTAEESPLQRTPPGLSTQLSALTP